MTKNSCLTDPFSIAHTLGIGFDNVFKKLNDMNTLGLKGIAFPPYNILKVDENKYVIEMAVAGFNKSSLSIELNGGVLKITGSSEPLNDGGGYYLYKGIADRAFTRTFSLADTVEVKNAELVNGMLKVFLENIIPEENKPKKIEIKSDT